MERKLNRGNFLRLLADERPGFALSCHLEGGGVFALPFLGLALGIAAGPAPWHSGSVLSHTARCMDECAGDPLAVWMAFVHDCGKLTTPQAMLPHHYGHELRGLALVPVWTRKLGLGEDFLESGKLAVRLHMRAGRYSVLRPGKKLFLLRELFTSRYANSFLRLVRADTCSPLDEVMRAHWQAVCHLPETAPLDEAGLKLLQTPPKEGVGFG